MSFLSESCKDFPRQSQTMQSSDVPGEFTGDQTQECLRRKDTSKETSGKDRNWGPHPEDCIKISSRGQRDIMGVKVLGLLVADSGSISGSIRFSRHCWI